ncbi:AAA family ATPase [Oxalobacter sp. OttesenSCG-928-P03]|nr:AAA family ATPase [Oxalobacter sp. OttesenSCG-928-P03]
MAKKKQNKTLEENINTLAQLLAANQLEPYIRHIRFPNYKNISPGTKIDFTFPITALVGANGTNKSSILRAIWATPGNNNLGTFWFSTHLDPILEEGGRSRFIYGYRNEHQNKIVEVIKTRIKRSKTENQAEDPDYWEPSRPIIQDGMEPMPKINPEEGVPKGRSRTRWNLINKNVLLLDFRGILSAFDKVFYHGDINNNKKLVSHANKTDFIRSRSGRLKKSIESGNKNDFFRKNQRIINNENLLLSNDEVFEISKILGREYSEIKIIRHYYFNCDAYTALIKTKNLLYTEAFAGSGEFSVIRTVYDISRASDGSLILMDEPETSLHPGAQDRLMDFLFSKAISKKLQIIISTHSSAIVRRLPKEAIKVLTLNPDASNIELLSQEAIPDQAFYYLGEPVRSKKTILVEDILSKEIVSKVLRSMETGISSTFDVSFLPGGAEALWKQAAAYAKGKNNDIFVLFDGDKRPLIDIPDPSSIPAAENNKLTKIIKDIAGFEITFDTDSNNRDQRTLMQRQFLSWANKHVGFFIDKKIPEAFIWDGMKKNEITRNIETSNSDAKKRFVELTKHDLGSEQISSEDILQTQRRALAKIDLENKTLSGIKEFINRAVTITTQ